MTKLSETVSTHISPEAKAQFLALAESAGLDESGLSRKLILEFIERERRVYEVLHSVFRGATDTRET